MQVYRQRIHDDHFRGLRADQICSLLRQQPVIGHPWVRRVEMAFQTEIGPVSQLLMKVGAHALWLQAERMSAEINAFISTLVLWPTEAFAKMRQRIAGIHCKGEFFASLKRSVAHDASSSG